VMGIKGLCTNRGAGLIMKRPITQYNIDLPLTRLL
jgi:hypothetical protein